MSLAKKLLNNPGLIALTVLDEQKEIIACSRPISVRSKGLLTVRLKRSFNQSDFNGSTVRYWRVIAPVGHANYMSDLSQLGLKEWGIIQ